MDLWKQKGREFEKWNPRSTMKFHLTFLCITSLVLWKVILHGCVIDSKGYFSTMYHQLTLNATGSALSFIMRDMTRALIFLSQRGNSWCKGWERTISETKCFNHSFLTRCKKRKQLWIYFHSGITQYYCWSCRHYSISYMVYKRKLCNGNTNM